MAKPAKKPAPAKKEQVKPAPVKGKVEKTAKGTKKTSLKKSEIVTKTEKPKQKVKPAVIVARELPKVKSAPKATIMTISKSLSAKEIKESNKKLIAASRPIVQATNRVRQNP